MKKCLLCVLILLLTGSRAFSFPSDDQPYSVETSLFSEEPTEEIKRSSEPGSFVSPVKINEINFRQFISKAPNFSLLSLSNIADALEGTPAANLSLNICKILYPFHSFP